jgi:hypothetical protein
MSVPALCEKCGKWFTNPFFDASGPGLTITSEGARINHPGCGGYGVIPEGEYRFTEAGVRATLMAGLSAEDIQQLVDLLTTVHGSASYEELVAIVETSPTAVREILKKFLPSDLATAQAYIAIFIAALVLVVAKGAMDVAHQDSAVAHSDAQAQIASTNRLDRDLKDLVPEIVREAIEQTKRSRTADAAISTTTPMMKRPAARSQDRGRSDRPFPGASLNSPCPCGSGRKYKKCHGKPEP